MKTEEKFDQVVKVLSTPLVHESVFANQRAKILNAVDAQSKSSGYLWGRQLPKGSLMALIVFVAAYFCFGYEGVLSLGLSEVSSPTSLADPMSSFGLVYLLLLSLSIYAIYLDWHVIEPRANAQNASL